MGLCIKFEFADGSTENAFMRYSSFHKRNICASEGKSHIRNMREHNVSECGGVCVGIVVSIMHYNCVKEHYLHSKKNHLPVRAIFIDNRQQSFKD